MLDRFKNFEKYRNFNEEADYFHNHFYLAMKEGLIHSVDYDFFCEKLDNLIKSYNIKYEIKKLEGYISLSIDISNVNKKQFNKELTSFMHNMGYFKPSIIDNNGLEIKSIMISKDTIFNITFQKRFDVPDGTPDILYHATTKYYYEKIKKIGLVPKSQNMISNDVDRVYLTDNLSDAKEFCAEKRKFFKNKYDKTELFNMNIDEWVILEVDISSIPDFKLYKDPKMKNSYYTYESILSYAIRVKERVNF